MKLKKIASLMLAGIMAVSMLAACGEGTDNGNAGSSSSEVPTVGGYTSTIYDALNGNSKELMTASSSSYLDLAVESAVDAIAQKNNFVVRNSSFDLKNNGDNIMQLVARFVGDKANGAGDEHAGGDWRVYGVLNTETAAANTIASNALPFEKGKTWVYVMVAPNGGSESALAGNVADVVDALMNSKVKNDAQYNYSYTLSATRELVGTENSGAYVIAVAISMNSTSRV